MTNLAMMHFPVEGEVEDQLGASISTLMMYSRDSTFQGLEETGFSSPLGEGKVEDINRRSKRGNITVVMGEVASSALMTSLET